MEKKGHTYMHKMEHIQIQYRNNKFQILNFSQRIIVEMYKEIGNQIEHVSC